MTSYAPAMLAAGLMLFAWGAISQWSVALLGVALCLYALWKWIGEIERGEMK